MLNNIKLIYANRQDPERCLRVVEQLVILNPDDPEQVRDRGLLRLRLEDGAGALTDLERFLELAPDSGSATTVKEANQKDQGSSHGRFTDGGPRAEHRNRGRV